MSLISKVTKRINFDKNVKYTDRIIKKHDYTGNLFTRTINGRKGMALNVLQTSKGFNVTLTYSHDIKSNVNYHFKYNRDGLLLLRGVSINRKMVISDESIPDFAIAGKPVNQSDKFEWVPAHASVKGASTDNALSLDYNRTFFKIKQTFNAVNPNFPDDVLWHHKLTHEISLERPFLEIENEVEFLQDTKIKKMYLTMLPANTKAVDKLYISNGTLFDNIPNDGTSINKQGNYSSAAYVGNNSSGLDYIAAVDTDETKERQSIITFRRDRVTKFYINEMSGIAKKGDIIKRKQRIVCLTGNVFNSYREEGSRGKAI